MKHKNICFLVITTIAFGIICCGCDKNATNPKNTNVSLAIGKNLWGSLVFVAKERGYFEEEGLNVTLNYQDAGRYCMDALLSDSVNFAAVVEANVGFLGFSGNQSPVIVTELVRSSSVIVARKSKGIEKPSDLRGKRIAYTPATGADPFLFRFLEKNGVSFKDVDLRKMQPKAIQPALMTADVDAASTWEPYVYNCINALGDDAVEFRDAGAFMGYMLLATRRDWAASNKDVVMAMLRALRKAEIFIAANPEESQSILARVTDMDQATVKRIWPYFTIKLQMDKPALLKAIRYVGENARITDPAFKDKPLPTYDSYVDESFLSKIGF